MLVWSAATPSLARDEIASDQLQLFHIPVEDADLDALIRLAHSLNGDEAMGAFERCAEIAHAPDHGSRQRRACLLLEARRWRPFGDLPGPEALAYRRQVVATIRACVEQRSA